MEIRTERLILRTARADDVEALHPIFTDPRAMRWWSTPPHERLEQTAEWLDSMIAGGPDQPDLVIERDGRVIGKAGFWRLPELGYILHPDHWGQGLAVEAVGAVIDHVFETGRAESVEADIDPGNDASIRLLERLGFVRTGSAERTVEVGGVWMDSVYYGLTREAWAVRQRG